MSATTITLKWLFNGIELLTPEDWEKPFNAATVEVIQSWNKRNIKWSTGTPKKTVKYTSDELLRKGLVGYYIQE